MLLRRALDDAGRMPKKAGSMPRRGRPPNCRKTSRRAEATMSDSLTDDAPVVIAVEHLHKAYGTTVAVDDVSFSVRSGEIFGVLGRNGAGKTTTVECLSGLAGPRRWASRCPRPRSASRTAGSCTSGSASSSKRVRYHRRSGSAKPSSSTPPSIGDPQTAIISLGCSGSTRSGARTYRELSGGQKQRLSIVLALIGQPEIAILDELTTGLDPAGAARDVGADRGRARQRGHDPPRHPLHGGGRAAL